MNRMRSGCGSPSSALLHHSKPKPGLAAGGASTRARTHATAHNEMGGGRVRVRALRALAPARAAKTLAAHAPDEKQTPLCAYRSTTTVLPALSASTMALLHAAGCATDDGRGQCGLGARAGATGAGWRAVTSSASIEKRAEHRQRWWCVAAAAATAAAPHLFSQRLAANKRCTAWSSSSSLLVRYALIICPIVVSRSARRAPRAGGGGSVGGRRTRERGRALHVQGACATLPGAAATVTYLGTA